jgi:hypothetical protein
MRLFGVRKVSRTTKLFLPNLLDIISPLPVLLDQVANVDECPSLHPIELVVDMQPKLVNVETTQLFLFQALFLDA